MRHIFLKRFINQFEDFPIAVQNKFQKQLNFLLNDLRHPSLHAKKYDKEQNIWQARIDKNIRFYFLIENDIYIFLEIKSHPK